MSSSKKRILIISDSIKRQTGYSTVATNIINQLSSEYEIAQLGIADVTLPQGSTLPVSYYSILKDHTRCCNRGHFIEYYNKDNGTITNLIPNIRVDTIEGHCPRGTNLQGDTFGQDSAFYVIQHFKPDIVIAINDVWAIYNINFLKNRKNFYYIPYLAVDSECFPVTIETQKHGLPNINTIQFIGSSDKVIVFTDWAKETINTTTRIAMNGKIASNIDVIPHGVDNKSFHPLNDKAELRKKFFPSLDENTFLVGVVQRNQPRKRMDAIFQTIRKFIDKYEEKHGKKVMVHFHCAMDDHLGWNLPWLAQYYGVSDRVIFDNKLHPGIGVPVESLNEIINTYDVHMTLTNSEGWGLPILETMAAGIPNIITDYSAHGDWASPAALKVKLCAKIHEVKTNHIKGIADIEHAAKQLSLLYKSPKMCREFSRKSLKLANELDWANVCEQWKETIDNIDISHFEDDRYNIELIKSSDITSLPEDPTSVEFELIQV
jgi:glycosyltransferase involved in cell wall biosynthesis